MRPKSLILLILALGCGLVASIGISEIIDSRGSTGGSVETEAILVTKAEIQRSSPLTVDNLMLEDWPKDKVPLGAIRDLAEVEGRRPLHKIGQGVVLQESMIGTGDQSVTEEIPPGYRVVGVTVNAKSGANLIRPGDRVDLQIFTRRNPSLGIKDTITRVFLEDITVFAVNQQIRSDEEDDQLGQARTISLLVTPKQAAKVTLATEIGTVGLIMRGGKDEAFASEDADTDANVADLLYDGKDEHKELDEDGQETQTAASGNTMADWLKKMSQGQQPSATASGGTMPIPYADSPFEMMVMRGSDVTVEQFDGESALAKVTDRAGEGKSSNDSGTSDSDDKSDKSDSDSDSNDGKEERVKTDD
ncbi:MAG: Flp pilus assembly protein CpaB [Pirellulales bacterium]